MDFTLEVESTAFTTTLCSNMAKMSAGPIKLADTNSLSLGRTRLNLSLALVRP